MANNHTIIEGVLLDEGHAYTLIELCEICVIEERTIKEMVEFGIIAPKEPKQEWIFTAQTLVRTQKALRLHRDLEINWAGISLTLDLLDEIKELRQLLAIKNQQL